MKCEMTWKIWKKNKLNSEKIGKIQKKLVKWYGKYRRTLWNDMENMDEMWNDMENMEERQVEKWKDMENMEEK
jgi:hypothetical protein